MTSISRFSDWNHEVIRTYDVVRGDMYGTIKTARCSVFVLNAKSIIWYR